MTKFAWLLQRLNERKRDFQKNVSYGLETQTWESLARNKAKVEAFEEVIKIIREIEQFEKERRGVDG